MNNILILYPTLFNCLSKFERKIHNITQSMGRFNVCYFEDSNKLIERFSSHSSVIDKSEVIQNIPNSSITHSIVFDDEQSFNEEIKLLKSLDIPLRIIKVKVTEVINIKRESQYKGVKSQPDYEYIGRGSYWGNPHSMFEDGDDREEVIRKYKYDFDFEKFPHIEKKEVYKLAGKKLGCFCKPATCHGDVLADYLNSWDDGK